MDKFSELKAAACIAAQNFERWSKLAALTSESSSVLHSSTLLETSQLLAALLAELEAKDKRITTVTEEREFWRERVGGAEKEREEFRRRFNLERTYTEDADKRIKALAPPAPAVLTDEQIDAVLDSHGNMAYVIADKRERLRMFAREILRAAMLAQPVSQGYKLPPHAYRELVNALRDTAVKYNGTDQLRERLNTALSQFIAPDHPHTRTATPERGNNA